jgi:hypothetical protein
VCVLKKEGRVALKKKQTVKKKRTNEKTKCGIINLENGGDTLDV